jgi:membrane protein implicated in regulation of membrane protease activity
MFETLHYWHWWVLAAVFVILELTVAGTFFFLWLAVAAAITGLVTVLTPGSDWEIQVLTWAILSIASVFAWRRFKPKGETKTDQPALNRRGTQYIGRVFTLEAPIVNGIGKLTVADTTWKIRGPDTPAGTHVRVTAVEGTSLMVMPADTPPEAA